MKLGLRRIAVTSACVPILATCGGGGGGGGDSGGGGAPANTVAITGNFTGGTNASLWERLLARVVPSAYALNVSLVARVILISVDGSVSSANVTGGRFTINASRGSPVGVIFVGANNDFLGYLSLAEGIDSVPLGKVASGTTTIDLQTLSSAGPKVGASRNPIGQDLPLTAEEQAAVKRANELFSAIMRSPDVDSNGVVDVLEGKYFGLQVIYEVRAGVFGGSVVPTVDPTPTFRSFALQVAVRDSDTPLSVSMTSPAGGGLSNQFSPRNFLNGTFATYYAGAVFNPPLPIAGQYTVIYKSQTLTFNVPDQSAVTANVVLPVPTVTLTSNGTVQRVNWAYRLGSGSGALDPLAFMQRVAVSIHLDSQPGPVAGNGCTSSPNLAPAVTEFVPQCQTPINWSDVSGINIDYIDLYGNGVNVRWTQQPGN